MLLVHEKVPVRRAAFPGSTSLYPLPCLWVIPRIFLQGFSCWHYLRVATFPPVSCMSGCVKQWVTALCRKPGMKPPQLYWEGKLGCSQSQAETQCPETNNSERGGQREPAEEWGVWTKIQTYMFRFKTVTPERKRGCNKSFCLCASLVLHF